MQLAQFQFRLLEIVGPFGIGFLTPSRGRDSNCFVFVFELSQHVSTASTVSTRLPNRSNSLPYSKSSTLMPLVRFTQQERILVSSCLAVEKDLDKIRPLPLGIWNNFINPREVTNLGLENAVRFQSHRASLPTRQSDVDDQKAFQPWTGHHSKLSTYHGGLLWGMLVSYSEL